MLDMKSNILVLLENKHPLKMYHCVLHVQSMSLTSAASTALVLCIAMFVTKAFNLDCPYIIYIIISVIIRAISAAVNISTSARKLFRND